MPRLLLTGGAGFIGSQLARTLLEAGIEPRVLDRLSVGGRREHLHGLPVELRRADVRDAVAVRTALRGCEALVHLAAESHVERSLRDPAGFLRVNVEGTRVVLEEAARAGIERVLIMSTDEVLGSTAPGQTLGVDAPLRPGNPYAASKAAAEALVHAWRQSFGLPAAILRAVNVFGPRQDPEKAVPWWAREALRGRPVPVQGDGSAERDWLHVEDLARGILALLRAPHEARTWHFAAHRQRPNREMARLVATVAARQTGQPVELVSIPERQGQDRRYGLDDQETRVLLGWAPMIGLEEGIEQTIDWIAHEGLALWS